MTQLTREVAAFILQLVGALVLVGVCFVVHLLLGALALGVALLGAGTLMERPHRIHVKGR